MAREFYCVEKRFYDHSDFIKFLEDEGYAWRNNSAFIRIYTKQGQSLDELKTLVKRFHRTPNTTRPRPSHPNIKSTDTPIPRSRKS